jgi:MFS family permease
VLFFGVLMAALDIATVGPALPAIREYFGVDDRSMAWVFNLFVLMNLVGLPVMARLSDLLGRRSVYVANVVLFATGALIVALAPTFSVLLAGRAVQGLGASGIFPVASAVVGDTYAPERRGRILGVIGAVFGLAFIIGPILGGILLSVGTWRWLFYVPLLIAVVVIAGSLRVLPRTRSAEHRPLDWRGAAVLVLGLGSIAYGISYLDPEALGASLVSASVWPFLLVGLALVFVFIQVERRAADPLLRLQLFRSRQVVLASLFAIGAGLTEAAFVFFSALSIAAYGVSQSTASYMLLPLVFAVAFVSPVAGRMLDRVGSRAVITTGTVLLTTGMAIMALLSTTTTLFYLASMLIGGGLSCLLGSSLSYILLNEAERTERTVAQGVVTLFMTVGQLTGGALVGAIATSSVDAADGYRTAFLVIAGAAFVLMLLAPLLKGRQAEMERARQAA